MKNQHISKLLTAIVLMTSVSVTLIGCGDSGNIFEKVYKKTPKETAQQHIEKGEYQEAVDVLQEYLLEEPDDIEAKSAYAYALSKLSNFEPSSILAKMSSNEGSTDSWQALAQAMPEGTQENVDRIKAAVDALASIPADQRTAEQNYQLAMANATLAVTQAKMVATDESGNLDEQKAQNMTEEQASTIVNAINDSNSALASSGNNNEQSEKLGGVSSQVNNSEGSTSKEKLTNYLRNK